MTDYEYDYDAAARAAYHAHQKAVGGTHRIAWSDLSDGDREIWLYVAEAVLLTRRPTGIQIGNRNVQFNTWP